MHQSLVPLYLNAAEYREFGEEFRPTALYDHPLTGGVMTMIGLALLPDRLHFRGPLAALLMAAMLAFGGRVAVVATIMSWTAIVLIDLVELLIRRDIRAIYQLVGLSAICLAGPLLFCMALSAGLGSRLAAHLYWDPSAQVRLAQWHLLGQLNWSQLLFGTTRDDLLASLNPLWLDYGVEVIENFWLLMFVTLGAAGFLIFLTGFFSLLCWCWSRTNLRGRVLLLAVVAVASTSNSLGRKSTLLVGLVAGVVCVSIRPPAQTRAVKYREQRFSSSTVLRAI
jgi:hypothetical protein